MASVAPPLAGGAALERKQRENVDAEGDEGSVPAPPAPAPLASSQYCLSQESNDFLAHLCQNLSDENDKLIALIRSGLGRLRSLQGLRDVHVPESTTGDDETNGPSNIVQDATTQDAPVMLQALAADMDNVLEHLHRILTDPSFVPLEEVEIREEEIARLKKGLDKMEAQWREAAATVDKWKAVVARDGDVVDHSQLQIGLSISPVKVQQHAESLDKRSLFDGESVGRQNRDTVVGDEEQTGQVDIVREEGDMELDAPLETREGHGKGALEQDERRDRADSIESPTKGLPDHNLPGLSSQWSKQQKAIPNGALHVRPPSSKSHSGFYQSLRDESESEKTPQQTGGDQRLKSEDTKTGESEHSAEAQQRERRSSGSTSLARANNERDREAERPDREAGCET